MQRTAAMFTFMLALILGAIAPVRASGIEFYFSPDGGAEDAVVRALDGAHHHVDIAIYALSNDAIVQAIRNAAQRGVQVRIVADKGQESEGYSAVPALACSMSVHYDTLSGLMHHKFAVIDDQTLLTGSFNWTSAAQTRNAENLLVIHDPQLIAGYEGDFATLWSTESSTAPCETKALLPGPADASPLVHINVATEAELESLWGVGKVLAERIVAYRTAHGPFSKVDDLAAVKGIGTRVMTHNQGRLAL
ncbi:MAG TPA: phospholipase D-like domain-containing protein [Limnochordia bacterium]|nr:phospholipase D-like domain-containing protein [Limnochordia bacterium]